MSTFAFTHRLRWPSLVCLTLCCLAWGCSWPDLRGPAFKDEPTIGRPAKPGSQASKNNGVFGFSTKAQQIERNLGVD